MRVACGNGVPGEDFALQTYAPGDLNGDGYTDLAIGDACAASDADPVDPAYCGGNGWVYIYPGHSTGVDATPATTLTVTTGYEFGASAKVAGDVNGDGYEDLVVGAPGDINPDGASNSYGSVFVFFGGSSGITGSPSQSYVGAQHSFFGAEVAAFLGFRGSPAEKQQEILLANTQIADYRVESAAMLYRFEPARM